MERRILSKKQLMAAILKDVENELDDEELIHRLLDRDVLDDADSSDERASFGQKAADKIARFAGSWTFIITFIVCLLLWMGVNMIFLKAKPFDPYPFILLNLVLSCVAAVQAPLIMMSQNRQEEKDRKRAENDYRVNLKTEFIIRDMHKKMDLLIENQKKIINQSGGK